MRYKGFNTSLGTHVFCIRVLGTEATSTSHPSFRKYIAWEIAVDGSSIWVSDNHVGDSTRIPDSWLQPGPTPSIMVFGDGKCFSIYLVLFLYMCMSVCVCGVYFSVYVCVCACVCVYIYI